MGKPLYELRPDIFPTGYLSDLEMQVWALYLDEREKELDALKNRR
jgi:hypothetical protein